jgi:hypothetical protein
MVRFGMAQLIWHGDGEAKGKEKKKVASQLPDQFQRRKEWVPFQYLLRWMSLPWTLLRSSYFPRMKGELNPCNEASWRRNTLLPPLCKYRSKVDCKWKQSLRKKVLIKHITIQYTVEKCPESISRRACRNDWHSWWYTKQFSKRSLNTYAQVQSGVDLPLGPQLKCCPILPRSLGQPNAKPDMQSGGNSTL